MLPSTSGARVIDNTMDEMTKLINNLLVNINILEIENQNQNRPIQENDNQNPNQFRRPFNDWFLSSRWKV